jgi:nitroreductase
MDIIKALEWRYAVKLFDPERKIPQESVDRLVEAVRLTPTSWGLQPFRLLVVEDAAIRSSLDGACYGQVQTGTSSHVFVFACRQDITVGGEFVENFFAETIKQQNMSPENAEKFRGIITGFLKSLSPEAQAVWEEKQAYIGLGNLMTVAAVEEIDACPMEGFVPKAVDEILGLSEKNLRPVLLCPVGYRHADDYYQNYKKIRVPTQDFVTVI